MQAPRSGARERMPSLMISSIATDYGSAVGLLSLTGRSTMHLRTTHYDGDGEKQSVVTQDIPAIAFEGN